MCRIVDAGDYSPLFRSFDHQARWVCLVDNAVIINYFAEGIFCFFLNLGVVLLCFLFDTPMAYPSNQWMSRSRVRCFEQVCVFRGPQNAEGVPILLVKWGWGGPHITRDMGMEVPISRGSPYRAYTGQVPACSQKPVDFTDTKLWTLTCLKTTQQETTNFTVRLLIESDWLRFSCAPECSRQLLLRKYIAN